MHPPALLNFDLKLSCMPFQVKTFESYQSREISNVKGMYDKQVEDLKAALDTMNKQYNQLKVGAEGLLQENEELKNK